MIIMVGNAGSADLSVPLASCPHCYYLCYL